MRTHVPPPWLLPVVTLCRHATIPHAERATIDEELDAQIELGTLSPAHYIRCGWQVGRARITLGIERGRVHVQWEATGGDVATLRTFAPALVAVGQLADACETLLKLPTAPPPT